MKDVLADIFNTSLCQAVVLTCLKRATIVPVPKKPQPWLYEWLLPCCLTPLAKCFDWPIIEHFKSKLHTGQPGLQRMLHPLCSISRWLIWKPRTFMPGNRLVNQLQLDFNTYEVSMSFTSPVSGHNTHIMHVCSMLLCLVIMLLITTKKCSSSSDSILSSVVTLCGSSVFTTMQKWFSYSWTCHIHGRFMLQFMITNYIMFTVYFQEGPSFNP